MKQTLDALLREPQARLAERGERLAARLIRSVLPVFVVDASGRPDRRGSCVLVQIDEHPFALTSRHVLNEGDLRLHAAPAPRGVLTPLPYRHAFGSSATELDVAVLPLCRSQLEAFAASVFVGGDETSEDHVVEQSLNGNSYFVIGYSASRSQVKVFHGDRRIKQASFQFTGLGEPIETYQRETLDPGGHLIVEFDRENLRFNGRSFVGPKVQGVSGGGVFHLADRSVAQRSTLVAIATQHRRRSRLIVGTRIEHFMRIARDLIATERSLFD